MNSKRKMLNDLSKNLKELQKEGKISFDSINQGIINHYSKSEGVNPSDFKTFDKWKKEGFSVKKGQNSFPIWGSPVNSLSLDGEYQKFFPMCHLFHFGQVEKTPTPSSPKALIPEFDATA